MYRSSSSYLKLAMPFLSILIFLFLLLVAPSSFAETPGTGGVVADPVDSLGGMADTFTGGAAGTKIQSFLDLIAGVTFIFGAIFGVKSLTQLKEHNESPQQVKLSKPLTSLVVSSLFLALPSFFDTLGNSLALAEDQGLSGVADAWVSVFSASAGAGSCEAETAAQGMVCFARSIPQLFALVSFLATMMGAFMIVKAIFTLPQVEMGRASTAQVGWQMLAGIGLWSFLPFLTATMGTLGVGLDSTGASGSITGKYAQSQSGIEGADAAIAAVMLFVQLLGLIAFARGILQLKLLGENKDGSLGRAMAHIFGGAAAINIVWTVKILSNSFGMQERVCAISDSICTNTVQAPLLPSVTQLAQHTMDSFSSLMISIAPTLQSIPWTL